MPHIKFSTRAQYLGRGFVAGDEIDVDDETAEAYVSTAQASVVETDDVGEDKSTTKPPKATKAKKPAEPKA